MSDKWPFAYDEPLQVLTPPQAATAVESWWYETPSGEGVEIWGYTDEISYTAGDQVSFHVHTTAPEYSVVIYRDGAGPEVVFERSGLPGVACSTPPDCYEVGCGWPTSFTVSVDAAWQTGGYVALLTATHSGRTVRHEHWFAVRPTAGTGDAILLVAATSTWIAYNSWGGANHYEGIYGTKRNLGCPRLSIQRPWSRGMAWIPVGVPRAVNDFPVPIDWTPRYPLMEWSLAAGYPKYTGAAGWAFYESHFVRWAEREGYRVHVVTQHDLHYRPDLLSGYRCVAFAGHDEYWSWEMRDHIDAFVDNGGHVAHFGGNFYWQIRFDEGGHVQTCYKYEARDCDPVRTVEDTKHLLTSSWDDPLVARPGARTLGLTAVRGMFAKLFAAPRGAGGYTVYRPEHWIFAGCDLYYGDLFGADANVFAYEVDGLAYTMREGLPYPTGEDGVTEDETTIVAMGVCGMVEDDHSHEGSVLFAGDTEAAFVAKILHGAATPENIARVNRGAGMIVEYRRGRGSVINVGSVEWVNGLRVREPFTTRITNNILRRCLSAS